MKRFQLHERTRRQLCQTLFLALAVMPTFCLCVFLLVQSLPQVRRQHTRAWEAKLRDHLGVEVHLTDARVLSPSQFVLEGMRLVHPETKREIGRIRLIEGEFSSQGWAIRLAQPEVKADQINACVQILHDWFLCRPRVTRQAVRLAMNDVSIRSTQGGMTLVDVSIDWRADEAMGGAKIGFQIAGDGSGEPHMLSVVRHYSGPKPRTELVLTTGSESLPCYVLADYLPAVKRLGPSCEFIGQWQIDWMEGDWRSAFNGRFSGVRWDWLTDGLPHRLTGEGELVLENCAIQNGRVVELQGQAHSTVGGRISQALLATASPWLGLQLSNPSTGEGYAYVSYQTLGIDFHINAQGATLQGLLPIQPGNPASPIGALVSDGFGYLAAQSPQPRVDNYRLVAWLQGQGGPAAAPNQVAWNQVGTWLASGLPWPAPAANFPLQITPPASLQASGRSVP